MLFLLLFICSVDYVCELVILYLYFYRFREVHKRVTCGSVIKLIALNHDARLHSHEVQYGSGSEQQSVTAVTDKIDSNSYWAGKLLLES